MSGHTTGIDSHTRRRQVEVAGSRVFQQRIGKEGVRVLAGVTPVILKSRVERPLPVDLGRRRAGGVVIKSGIEGIVDAAAFGPDEEILLPS